MINRKALVFLIILVLAFASILFLQDVKQNRNEDAVSVIKIGDQAPKIKLTSISGETMELAALKGKVVLVNFWATWCPPCIKEIPSLIKAYDDLKSKGFEILAFSIDSNGKKIVPGFVKEHGINYPVILDVDQKYARSFSVFGVPENILINKKGKIVTKKYGADDWGDPIIRKEIEALLNE